MGLLRRIVHIMRIFVSYRDATRISHGEDLIERRFQIVFRGRVIEHLKEDLGLFQVIHVDVIEIVIEPHLSLSPHATPSYPL